MSNHTTYNLHDDRRWREKVTAMSEQIPHLRGCRRPITGPIRRMAPTRRTASPRPSSPSATSATAGWRSPTWSVASDAVSRSRAPWGRSPRTQAGPTGSGRFRRRSGGPRYRVASPVVLLPVPRQRSPRQLCRPAAAGRLAWVGLLYCPACRHLAAGFTGARPQRKADAA
jgi:hypothetical protein